MTNKNNIDLHFETVTPLLMKALHQIMDEPIFNPFLLVGGTSFSLRFGHRKSVDIDLFTNAPYGSLDFSVFENFFKERYDYYHSTDTTQIVSFGRSYYIGKSEDKSIKVDIFYHEEMNDTFDLIEGIRFASVADVTAMKIDVISRGGRKKDFWDLHELMDRYTISQMLDFHKSRYEFTHDRNHIISQLLNCSSADDDFDPICLKGKVWELIKLDIIEALQ